ncbi:MAG: beta-galactosidase trimerization domain-containing protein [Planctomycetes bacterium]|nr:beta-galactosidase trimerization domain-containing protein [Planctomycetota bacterium]
MAPADVDPAAGSDYARLSYTPTPEAAKTRPGQYYWSQLYRYHFGIRQLKERTDILRRYLPHAGIGANFSPHGDHMYLGTTHQWITVFREGGMTMPWGEDYIFQVPVGSPQMNALVLDMFRAGLRHQPGARIHYYVMAHAPNNTPHGWRRQFYLDLAHGVRVFNLFEFRPVQAAYTENHVDEPAMYQEVRTSLHELGRFEDIVQEGRVLPAQAALWFSEAGDVWDNNRPPRDAAKRCLYIALRQQQLPLDFVVEGDDLKAYRVLYLADANVSRAASRAIADWVRGGGRLFATAGAGLFDEFNQPNRTLRELLGIEPLGLEEAPGPPVRLEKQDLPYAAPLDLVLYQSEKIPVFGLRSRVKAGTAEVMATFSDRSPAVTMNRVGQGTATYCAFLPGLSYFQPALPRRPMDRGATDDSMAHFLPTEFSAAAGGLVGMPAADLVRPVSCSSALVESTVLKAGRRMVIPLINWSPTPVKGLTITVRVEAPGAGAALASGRPVRVERQDGAWVFTLDLDVADALILR